jgi:uncharacterized membrane protein
MKNAVVEALMFWALIIWILVGVVAIVSALSLLMAPAPPCDSHHYERIVFGTVYCSEHWQ